MSQPSWPQPQPPKPKMSKKRKAAFWVGGVFVAFIVLGVIGAATGAGKKTDTGDSASSQTIVVVDTASSPAAQPASPSPVAVMPSSPAAVPHTSAAAVKTSVKPKPKPSPSCTLPDDRDVYVFYKVPGVDDSAQELGEVDLANCTPTVDMIMSTSPTGAGYCTQVGYVDQNPNYDVNAEVAKPLKHIIQEVGAGC